MWPSAAALLARFYPSPVGDTYTDIYTPPATDAPLPRPKPQPPPNVEVRDGCLYPSPVTEPPPAPRPGPMTMDRLLEHHLKIEQLEKRVAELEQNPC